MAIEKYLFFQPNKFKFENCYCQTLFTECVTALDFQHYLKNATTLMIVSKFYTHLCAMKVLWASTQAVTAPIRICLAISGSGWHVRACITSMVSVNLRNKKQSCWWEIQTRKRGHKITVLYDEYRPCCTVSFYNCKKFVSCFKKSHVDVQKLWSETQCYCTEQVKLANHMSSSCFQPLLTRGLQ